MLKFRKETICCERWWNRGQLIRRLQHGGRWQQTRKVAFTFDSRVAFEQYPQTLSPIWGFFVCGHFHWVFRLVQVFTMVSLGFQVLFYFSFSSSVSLWCPLYRFRKGIEACLFSVRMNVSFTLPLQTYLEYQIGFLQIQKEIWIFFMKKKKIQELIHTLSGRDQRNSRKNPKICRTKSIKPKNPKTKQFK